MIKDKNQLHFLLGYNAPNISKDLGLKSGVCNIRECFRSLYETSFSLRH